MRVCVMAYKFYESSPRVMMFSNTLARRGDSVDVIALRRPGQAAIEDVGGVRVHRIQERTRNEHSQLTYLFRILTFLLRSAAWITRQHLRRSYDLVHVFSVPDFLVFAAVVPRALGTPIVLDCYDLVPELYASKFDNGKVSIVFKVLVWLERASVALASHVVLPIEVWRDRLVMRSAPPCKCSVIHYHPDPEIFFPRPRVRRDDRLILIYSGTLNAHQGLDVAIGAFARIAPGLPRAEFHIYGEGPAEPELRNLVEALGLGGRVLIRGFLAAEQIAAVMTECDVAVVPKRASSQFGNEAPSTKILDYMAVGVPVIASRTAVEESYLNGSVVQFFTSEDEQELADSMLLLLESAERRTEIASNASRDVVGDGWERKQEAFVEIVDAVCGRHGWTEPKYGWTDRGLGPEAKDEVGSRS